MSKKAFIIILIIISLFSLNLCFAQDLNNSDDINLQLDNSSMQILEKTNDDIINSSDKADTRIGVESNTTFDVIGDYFKIRLFDENNDSISNVKVSFAVNGVNYNENTDSNGVASLQIRLADGTYNVVTKFAGNSNYKASSLTSTITMSNTRIVGSGLSGSEIQKIIDDAKPNNVILFKGNSYSNVNLVITKSLKLISYVNTVLKSGSSSPVISIKGKNASLTSIRGFYIQGNGNGIDIADADYVTVFKNDISTKGNGISALNVKYLNVTKNNIVKNSKNGMTLALAENSYIMNNEFTNNGENGIVLSKSNKVYIQSNVISSNGKNGISLTDEVNGEYYNKGPENVYIRKNTISKNKWDGISITHAEDNVNINYNTISSNEDNGISINRIGSNKIQSNTITNSYVGIKFGEDYVKPSGQDITYNAIYQNRHVQIEAKETYYSENGERLSVGDNWYTDDGLNCPKVRTNNLKFVVNQIGENQFQALFLDSNGNIATLLPDRVLNYRTNDGQTLSVTISGGSGTFTVNAVDGDIIKATVDRTSRKNAYDSNTPSSTPINGQTPSYDYPDIPQYDLFEDIGKGGGSGNGNGNGQGDGGDFNKGNGSSKQQSSENTGNSTQSQSMEPNNNPSNPVNDVAQSYESTQTASQASASQASSASDSDSGSKSVAKQIIIDEDEFFRVSGITFIILLIILTIGFYYRDDIKEMNSKR